MIIYYGTTNNLNCHQPDPLISCLFEHLKVDSQYIKCPSFQEVVKKMYVIRSTYDYELNVDCENGKIHSKMYNQHFFDNNIITRNIKSGVFSYLEPEIVFFSEKSLEIEILPAFFHNAWKRHPIIPGKFNIAKHFRKLECAVHLLYSDTLKINDGDPLYYVRFFTDEKITFKRFLFTDKILQIMDTNLSKKNFTKKIIPLKWYYENSYNKSIFKEIKNNLLE